MYNICFANFRGGRTPPSKSASGAYNAPHHTHDKNDVVTKTNDTERLEAGAYPRPQDNKFTSRQDQGHDIYDTNAFSDKGVSFSMSHNEHNRDNATQRFDIILLLDSLYVMRLT